MLYNVDMEWKYRQKYTPNLKPRKLWNTPGEFLTMLKLKYQTSENDFKCVQRINKIGFVKSYTGILL